MCGIIAICLFWRFAIPAQRKRAKEQETSGTKTVKEESHTTPNSAKFFIDAIKEGIDEMITEHVKRKISEQVESMSRRTSITPGHMTK